MGAKNSCEISRLPEECLSRVISLTSPQDACRCSAVSTFLQSAAAADDVWVQFLPTDIDKLLSKMVDQPVFTTKKDLYFHLCNRGILVDDGRMILRLEKRSGAKIYMLSAARAVGIIWGDNPQYWQRVPHQDSPFLEVQQLILVWWVEIWKSFSCKNLTPKTRYAAYFVFKLEDDSNGFDLPLEAVIVFSGELSRHHICLQPSNGTIRQNPNNPIRYPQVRDHDQWLEVEIGEFYNDGEDVPVEAQVEEKKGLWAKRGLIFNGIEFRPKL